MKFDRIQRVKNFGLNTEDSILVKLNDDYTKFIKGLNHVSIRTDKKFGKTPAFPYININKLSNLINLLHARGLDVILAKPINPKDCIFCGAAMIHKNKYTIELVNGPGTVRRVTNEGKIDERYIINRNQKTDISELDYCVTQFNKTKLQDAIFEFSWYNKPIGYKKEKFICWEITKNGY